jgi:hypothetical protein
VNLPEQSAMVFNSAERIEPAGRRFSGDSSGNITSGGPEPTTLQSKLRSSPFSADRGGHSRSL